MRRTVPNLVRPGREQRSGPRSGCRGSAGASRGSADDADALYVMTHQVLARKFRPQSPGELVGQPALVTWLRRTLDQEKLAQAYLFSGIRGVGKTSAARILAKGLNCLDPDPRKRPCNQCSACSAITAGRHVDVLEIDAATYSKVEQVRELADSLRYGPAEGRYKVVILDEVHRLSRQAFDALLKLLEEPPPHLVFLFATTEIEAVPATILSRCQEFHLRRVPVATLTSHLESVAAQAGIRASPRALEAIARASEGSVRDAVSLLDQLATFGHGEVQEEDVHQLVGGLNLSKGLEVLEAIARGDARSVSRSCRELVRQGVEPRDAHRALLDLAGEALGFALRGAEADVELPVGTQEQLARLARTVPYLDLLRLTQHLLSSEPLVRRCELPELALELAWLRAAELPRLVQIEELLRGAPPSSAQPPSEASGRSRPPLDAAPPSTPRASASQRAAVLVEPSPDGREARPTLPGSPERPLDPSEPSPPRPRGACEPSFPFEGSVASGSAPLEIGNSGGEDRAATLQQLLEQIMSRRPLFAAQLEKARLELTEDELRILPLPDDTLLLASLSKPTNLELVEQAAREVLGRTVQIRCQGQLLQPESEGPNRKQTDLEAVTRHLKVQEVLEVFGGQVVDVVPLAPRSRRKSE